MELATAKKKARYQLEEMVKNLKGEVIEINRVERVQGAAEPRYNGIYWESDLIPLVEAIKPASRIIKSKPLYAFENLRDGTVTFKTKPFTGNQYIRPISLEGYQLL